MEPDGSVTEERNGVVIKRRGRPAGSKDKRKRIRRRKEECMEPMEKCVLAMFEEALLGYTEDVGEFLEAIVLLTSSECFRGPYAVRWMESDDKERLTLEVMNCWRPIADDDLKGIKEREGNAVSPKYTL